MAYVSILTNKGQQKIAAASAGGAQLQITQMALGDGNGAQIAPAPTMLALEHEVHRAAVTSLTVHPTNPNWLRAELVVPADTGGWTIREVGLYDAAGDLVAISQFPDTYKPVLADNVIGEGRVRITIAVSNASAVQLVVDPSAVYATQEYTDNALAAHSAAADPHTQYLRRSELAVQHVAPAATLELVHGGTYEFDSTTAARAGLLPDPNPADGRPITIIRRGGSNVDILRKQAAHQLGDAADDLRLDKDHQIIVLSPESATKWQILNRRK